MSRYGLSPISNPVKMTVLNACFERPYALWAGKLIWASLYPHLSASDVTGGYRQPVLCSHTLLLRSTNIPEGTASTFDFNIPFSHLTSDKNKKAQSNSSQMESSALCLGNWLFSCIFILLLKWILPYHGAFRKFFLCFL